MQYPHPCTIKHHHQPFGFAIPSSRSIFCLRNPPIRIMQTHWSFCLILQYPHLGYANPLVIFLGITIPSYCQYLFGHIGHMFNTLIGEHLGASSLIARCQYCKIGDGWCSRYKMNQICLPFCITYITLMEGHR